MAVFDAVAAHWPCFESLYEAGARWAAERRSVLNQFGVRSVLDASVGAGRKAFPLSRLGLEVTGTDESAKMIAEAEASAAREGLTLRLVQCDVRELSRKFGAEFDCVHTDALRYLPDAIEVRHALRSMYRVTKQGGICLLDVAPADAPRAQGLVIGKPRKTGESTVLCLYAELPREDIKGWWEHYMLVVSEGGNLHHHTYRVPSYPAGRDPVRLARGLDKVGYEVEWVLLSPTGTKEVLVGVKV